MFTGIVEEVGKIARIEKNGVTGKLSIIADTVLEGTKIGDSIAVNGVCLTVTSLKGDSFTADVMGETFRRSSLGDLQVGSVVNLERAMPADGRFGGHIVSGHIDGMGEIISIEPEGTAVWYTLSAPAEILQGIVEKGSIAIDGISLTVARITAKDFAVSIIPHTGGNTILSHKKAGDKVNLENDIIGKYVQKFLQPQQEQKESHITEDFLRGYGFL
ncbi:MAG: riboflavin synthase [Lachnospiraceae bacterium]|nr:riboflavin synthase [Lachnospiraceae bacterium]